MTKNTGETAFSFTLPRATPRADTVVAAGVVLVVVMMILPLPGVVLDILLSVNLAFCLAVIFMALRVRNAPDFAVFPTIVLVLTVFGLALNISTTRSILTLGPAFDGRLIRSFGAYAIGRGTEGLVVGPVMFALIIAVQGMVIAKGAGRIAEVAARFTLDGLPGKQMAIDAELGNGSLDAAAAAARRMELQRGADFYGQMDGAAKFVAGNVRLAVFICVVDILGGLVVGVAVRGEDLATALRDYTALTIGDGLLAQIPSLLVSVAMGILVTRANAGATFADQTRKEFASESGVFLATAAVLAVLALLPGFPWYILLPVSGTLSYAALRRPRSDTPSGHGPEIAGSGPGSPGRPAARNPAEAVAGRGVPIRDRIRSHAPVPDAPGEASIRGTQAEAVARHRRDTAGAGSVSGTLIPARGAACGTGETPTRFPPAALPEPFSLELGFGLVRLAVPGEPAEAVVDRADGGHAHREDPSFPGRVGAARRRESARSGVPVPPLRIVDNGHLHDYGFVFRIAGEPVLRGVLKPGKLLARGPGPAPASWGDPAVEPGRWTLEPGPAYWIPRGDAATAVSKGFEVLDHGAILLDASACVMRNRAADLFGRRETGQVMESLAVVHPDLVDETRALLSPGDVRQVLRLLLREQVPLRAMDTVFETLADKARSTRDTAKLAGEVRISLGAQIWKTLVEPSQEGEGRNGGERDPAVTVVALDADTARRLAQESPERIPGLAGREAFALAYGALPASARSQGRTVLICPAPVRAGLRALAETTIPVATVIAEEELPPDARFRIVATLAF